MVPGFVQGCGNVPHRQPSLQVSWWVACASPQASALLVSIGVCSIEKAV